MRAATPPAHRLTRSDAWAYVSSSPSGSVTIAADPWTDASRSARTPSRMSRPARREARSSHLRTITAEGSFHWANGRRRRYVMTALLTVVAAALAGAAAAYLVVSRRAARQVADAHSTADRLLANASDAIIACAADGVTITMWNPAAERLFGWRSEEVIGRQVPTLGDVDVEQERSDLLDRVRAGERVSVVTRRVRKDGTPIVVRISYSALPAADGGFNGWMGTVADVTEELEVVRERTERAALVERLNGIVADINAELDLGTVLDRITEAAQELSGASAAGFALVEEDGVRIASASGSI